MIKQKVSIFKYHPNKMLLLLVHSPNLLLTNNIRQNVERLKSGLKKQYSIDIIVLSFGKPLVLLYTRIRFLFKPFLLLNT